MNADKKTMWRLALLLLALFPVLVCAFPEPTPDELEHNRQQVLYYRRYPDHLAKLRQHIQQLQALPEPRRREILKLDQDLHKENAARQQRLSGVLERYADWYERLAPADRQRLDQAADAQARLAIVRELRDREWMAGQPKAVRAEYDRLGAAERLPFIAKLRQQERQRAQEWQIAARFWGDLTNRRPLPARLAELPQEVQQHVNEYLRLVITKEDNDRLDKAQGQWPLFLQTLVELADKHPPALPGKTGPTTIAQLPNVVKNALKNKNPKVLKEAEGKWPDFGQAVAGFAAKKLGISLPMEFFAYEFRCLAPGTQDFVDTKLRKVLNNDEKLMLEHAKAKWPEYPQTLDKLARDHGLRIPWQTLPGPRESWDAYRLGRKDD